MSFFPLLTFPELMMSLEIGLIYSLVAMGIYLTFRVIDFPDLTCDGSFVLGAALSSILLKGGYHPWLGFLASLLGGLLAGIGTGLLYTCLKVTDLLAGILVAFMLYSINLHVMGGVPNMALGAFQTLFTTTEPLVLLVFLILTLGGIVGYTLLTDFGLALRSIGQNKRLAQNGGIHVPLMTVIGLAFSNALIAGGGSLLSQHQGFADVGSGSGTVIVGLASLLVGERLLPSPSVIWQVASCILGSVVYRLLIGVALHSDALGLETQDLNLLTGLLVIGIISLPKGRLSAGKKQGFFPRKGQQPCSN